MANDRSTTTRIQIEKKLTAAFEPVHVDIVDETVQHLGHTGALSGGGHFILTLVSPKFEGVSLLNRNRMVYDCLKNEMAGEIHALAIRAYAPGEWAPNSFLH